MKKRHLFLVAGGAGALLGFGIYAGTKRKQEKAKARGEHVPHGPYEACIKRPLDLAAACAGLLILSPAMGILALLVKGKLGKPVLFTQERAGKADPETGKEKIFRLYKFRTMTDARDGEGKLLPDGDRLTEFGKKLRSTSLDELPELFNIVKGDMSIIGPRPLLVRYLPAYTEKERHRHDVRPGLSGLAQVKGRNYIKWDQRLCLDIQYVEKITLLGDLKILIATILKVFRRDDVAVNTDEVESYLDEERGERQIQS